MIHTKQPANQFYVFLTAYRSHECTEVNEIHTRGMANLSVVLLIALSVYLYRKWGRK